jgi:hypothetical protein
VFNGEKSRRSATHTRSQTVTRYLSAFPTAILYISPCVKYQSFSASA